MSLHTTTPPLTQNLAPGQSAWICLVPGSTLRTTQGDVTVHWPPQACGLTLHAPPPSLLGAGQHLPQNGQAQAVWLQLHNPLHRFAEVQLMEAAAAPRPWQRVWRGLRAAVQSPRKAATDSGHSEALHAAR
ncbi:MAG: hypothetical protein QE485_16190 [Acidovorax sp.]|uniref:hypothetical protein n=1 Tax=Acidovorax sp. TaxID=1872122 RepID=UPI00261A36B3|nr:hypothetical protein [Acidovorax sp.]MDH4418750.1 hypothetical protein [Acidovorax sp.]